MNGEAALCTCTEVNIKNARKAIFYSVLLFLTKGLVHYEINQIKKHLIKNLLSKQDVFLSCVIHLIFQLMNYLSISTFLSSRGNNLIAYITN